MLKSATFDRRLALSLLGCCALMLALPSGLASRAFAEEGNAPQARTLRANIAIPEVGHFDILESESAEPG